MRPGAVHWQKLWSIVAALPMLLNGCGTNKTVLEEIVEQVYPIALNTDLSIHNRDGAVLVYGSDGNELRVRSAKKAYSRERLSQIAVDVSTTPGAVSVTAKFPPQPKWAFSDHSGTVDCTIVVPATASITALDLNSGEVLLDSMRGREVFCFISCLRYSLCACCCPLNCRSRPGSKPSCAKSECAHGKIANDFNNVASFQSSSARYMNIDQVINGGGSATIQIRLGRGNIKIAEANP